jgi:hypothetical protein
MPTLTIFYVQPKAHSHDLTAAANYINRRAEAGGYTHDRRAIEDEIAGCSASIRDDLTIEEDVLDLELDLD